VAILLTVEIYGAKGTMPSSHALTLTTAVNLKKQPQKAHRRQA
jgi:hypothetical protein